MLYFTKIYLIVAPQLFKIQVKCRNRHCCRFDRNIEGLANAFMHVYVFSPCGALKNIKNHNMQ